MLLNVVNWLRAVHNDVEMFGVFFTMAAMRSSLLLAIVKRV